MNKDRLDHRSYRKYPGRQYDYELDPLNKQQSSRSGQLSTSAQNIRDTDGLSSGRSGRSSGQLAPRPDPRRTRQLMRQSIIASKAKSALLEEPELQQADFDDQQVSTDDDQNLYRNRPLRRNRSPQPFVQIQEQYPETEDQEMNGPWSEDLEYLDPDLGYEEIQEDPLAQRLRYPEFAPMKPPLAPERRTRHIAPPDYEEDQYDYDYYEEEEEEQPRPRRRRKKGLSRRKLLVGLGLLAVGGGVVAAEELGPKLPQALSSAGTDIERQLQDAFNRGVASGAEAVRKDFVTALDNMEGVSLASAMAAAKLTRIAYDVFVSPLVTLAATVTGDFLNLTLQGLITARSWLRNIGQDNPTTLGALQTVLQTWVNQVNNMPKQLQAITDADLDGAQSYLRGLQRKLDQEKALLNPPKATPTPKPTAPPKH